MTLRMKPGDFGPRKPSPKIVAIDEESPVETPRTVAYGASSPAPVDGVETYNCDRGCG